LGTFQRAIYRNSYPFLIILSNNYYGGDWIMRTDKKCHFNIILIMLVMLPFLCSTTAFGDIIHVPGDQPTIQDGIDAAKVGDTVCLADGTYTGEGNKNLDFGGKAITVKCCNGPGNCIIDCENDGRGVIFNSLEGTFSVFSGITIKKAQVHQEHMVVLST
jgi:hypothetical protein